MFLFVIWGNKWRHKTKGNGLRVEKFCPECDRRGEFFEVVPTEYFTLFFIPIFRLDTKKPLLECPNCHTRFYIQPQDYLSGVKTFSKSNNDGEIKKEDCIIVCENCGKKLRVPRRDDRIKGACPSCRSTIYFQNGQKA